MLLLIYGCDLGIHNIAHGEYILGLAYTAVGDLGDMDKSVNAGQDLCKSAEGHELDDGNGGNAAHLVLVGESSPGVGIGVLVAQGDLALLLVEVDDVDINLVAHGEDLGGLVDTSPAKLGHMYHTVDAADVHKSAVAGHGLDNTVVMLAYLDLIPDGLGALTALSLSNAADRSHHTLAGLVYLGDLKTHGLLQQLAHIGIPGQIGLGGRNENANTLDVYNNAALILLGDNAFHNGAVVNGLFDFGPHLGCIQALLGQHSGALDIVDAHNHSFDGVAHLDNVLHLDAVVGELGSGDKAGILGAQINTDLSAGDSNYNAGYLISIIYSFESLLQHFVKGLFLLNWGLFDFDFVAHFVSYLLNYPRRCGCSGCESDNIGFFKLVQIQLRGFFNELDIGAILPAYLCQMNAVGTVLPADDHHGITFRGKLCRFLLPRERSKTYCIRYFRICTSFFYYITTFSKIIASLCGLYHDCYWFSPIFCIFIQPYFQILRIFKYGVIPAPAADAFNFRVFRHSNYNDEAILRRCPADYCMYSLYLWARGVHHLTSGFLQLLTDFPGNTVSPYEHVFSLFQFLRPLYDPHSSGLQPAHHILVVYELSQAGAALMFFQELFRHIHRAADSKAESGALSHSQLSHGCPSLSGESLVTTSSASRRKLSSKSISLVSTTRASSAAFKGAAALLLSCLSLYSISRSTSSKFSSMPLLFCSSIRRFARASLLAVRNIFSSASGSTTVPMSRPSIITLFFLASSLCISRR